MSLPNLSAHKPTYNITLPISGEKVQYQPYLRSQEKNLLIAAQEDDYGAVISTLKTLISDCCSTEFKTVGDFVYAITHVKAKSTGETHSFILNECKCGKKQIQIEVADITKAIKIKNQENLKDIYQIEDTNFALKLVPTKANLLDDLNFESTVNSAIEQADLMIAHSIDYVIVGEEIYKDFTTEQLLENIVRNLTSKQAIEINEKIGNLASIIFECEYTCPSCKNIETVEISDFLF